MRGERGERGKIVRGERGERGEGRVEWEAQKGESERLYLLVCTLKEFWRSLELGLAWST